MTAPSPTPTSHDAPPATRAVILFDGVCTLCNGFVNFVIDRDPKGLFQFAALQSDEAQALLRAHGEPVAPAAAEHPDGGGLLQSVVLVEEGRVYRKSTAALRIARRLTGAWPLAYAFIAIPKRLRDAVYDGVAARRYAWFGKRDQCRIPTPDLQRRFLERSAPSG